MGSPPSLGWSYGEKALNRSLGKEKEEMSTISNLSPGLCLSILNDWDMIIHMLPYPWDLLGYVWFVISWVSNWLSQTREIHKAYELFNIKYLSAIF